MHHTRMDHRSLRSSDAAGATRVQSVSGTPASKWPCTPLGKTGGEHTRPGWDSLQAGPCCELLADLTGWLSWIDAVLSFSLVAEESP